MDEAPPVPAKPGSRSGPGRGHRLVEHTADIGIGCWAPSLAELFREAARGLMEVMIGPYQPVREEELQVELRCSDREELLVVWLNELLFIFESRRLVFADIDFSQFDDRQLQGRLWGECLRGETLAVERQVKAATYHQLQVAKDAETWRATVYLDL